MESESGSQVISDIHVNNEHSSEVQSVSRPPEAASVSEEPAHIDVNNSGLLDQDIQNVTNITEKKRNNGKRSGKVDLTKITSLKKRTTSAKSRASNIKKKAYELAKLCDAEISLRIKYSGGKNCKYNWAFTSKIDPETKILNIEMESNDEECTLSEVNMETSSSTQNSENSNVHNSASGSGSSTQLIQVDNSQEIVSKIDEKIENTLNLYNEKLVSNIEEIVKKILLNKEENIGFLHGLSPIKNSAAVNEKIRRLSRIAAETPETESVPNTTTTIKPRVRRGRSSKTQTTTTSKNKT